MPHHNSGGIQQTMHSSFRFSSIIEAAAPHHREWAPKGNFVSESEGESINGVRETAYEGYASTDEDNDWIFIASHTDKRLRLAQPGPVIIASDSEEEIVMRDHIFLEEAESSTQSNGTKRKPRPASPKIRLTEEVKINTCTLIPRIESEDDSDVPDVICISDTESDWQPCSLSAFFVKQDNFQRTKLMPYGSTRTRPALALDNGAEDFAILTFDPHVRSKPILHTPTIKSKTPAHRLGLLGPTLTPKSPKPRKVLTPENLGTYARTQFNQLNAAVFDAYGGIPLETLLVWNVRLRVTAGRAVWSPNENGEMTSKIELATKVLDSKRRVRNTLAHEMCHLAVWILDGDMDAPEHGKKWKEWADRVMESRSDINIAEKHDYKIHYKFEWECVDCGKVYSRHSDSIDLKQYFCALCEDPRGRLRPLFEKPKRRPARKRREAPGYPTVSPRSLNHPPRTLTRSSTGLRTTLAITAPRMPGSSSDLTDEDEGIKELIEGLERTEI